MAEQPQPAEQPERNAAPGLGDTLDALQDSVRANVSAATSSLHAFRHLLGADLALARAALAYACTYGAIAIALGGSAWLLLMALIVATLQWLGLPWVLALLCVTLLSLAGTLAAAIAAKRAFAHTGLHASRRQLANLGALATSAPAPEPAPTPEGKTP